MLRSRRAHCRHAPHEDRECAEPKVTSTLTHHAVCDEWLHWHLPVPRSKASEQRSEMLQTERVVFLWHKMEGM